MTSRKFNPRCDSDKQTIPWATSLRATCATMVLVNFSPRYSTINHVWRLFTNILVYFHSRKIFFVPDIQVYHSQKSQQPGEGNTIKISWRRSDTIRCLWVINWPTLSSHITVRLSPRYLCYMYYVKHMYEIYAVEIYSKSQICLCGRMHMTLFNSAKNLELSLGQ